MQAQSLSRPLALVTGASSGIGLELARQCALNGFDLIIAADRPMQAACDALMKIGANVQCVEVDLARTDNIDRLYELTRGRPVDALLANAGHGLGKAFLNQAFVDVRHVVDTNITGTIYLIHRIGNDMRQRRSGKILITGSIAGFMPGTFQAVYNGTKAFIDSFSWALRSELQDSGVTVTCLMPGVTDTEFFRRADLMDTRIGASDEKMDPADVARAGFRAMMDGAGHVVTGFRNKVQVAMANITPDAMLARQHRRMAEPGSARAGH